MVEEAQEEAEVTDQPFIPQELARAKKRGRDTAMGANGAEYSMLTHAGPGGEAALLAVFNVSWLAGCLPPTWKIADIQSVPKLREPNNFGPISLFSCTAKAAGGVRLTSPVARGSLGGLHPRVFSLTRGVSTADSHHPADPH